MKKTTSKQAESRFRLNAKRATSGMYSAPRILALFLLCGCLSVAPAVWSQTRSSSSSSSRTAEAPKARTEKRATEPRTEKKTEESRSTRTREEATRTPRNQETDRNQEVARNQETDRNQEVTRNQEDTRSRATMRSQEPNARPEVISRSGNGRDAGVQRRPEEPLEVRSGGSSVGTRMVPTTRMSIGYRLVPGSRIPDRNKFQMPDIRFRHDRERCTICFGIGFVYTHDRLHRLRCSHCFGRGFEREFLPRLEDVCPICYGPVSVNGPLHRRSIQNTANYVTDRLDYLLSLSSSQERAIKRIVLDYLRDSRYDTWYDPIVVRDRMIMRELTSRQRDIYVDFVNNLDARDLCDRCFDYF